MKEKIKNILFYAGVTKEEYQNVRSDIIKANRRTVMIFSAIAFVLVCTMTVVSFFQAGLEKSRVVYIMGIAASVLVFLLAYLFVEKHETIHYFAMYICASFFLIYGILIGTVTRPEEQTVTFMVLLLLLPLIFIDRPVRMGAFLAIYVGIFIAAAFQTKAGSVLSVDVTDAVIFGILAFASGTVVTGIKVRSYVLEMKLQQLSEIDQLTGLNNRNCYEWRLDAYPEKCRKSLCCVYIDVNGLHSLNNTKGHRAGDEMLCSIAKDIKNLFGSRDSYRIGGDEYVVLAVDEEETAVRAKLAELEKTVQGQGYHIAMGYEFQGAEDLDMKSLIAGAEKKMFANKNDFYEKTGNRR